MTFSNWLRKTFCKVEYTYGDMLIFGTFVAIASHGIWFTVFSAVCLFVWATYIREHINNEGNDND